MKRVGSALCCSDSGDCPGGMCSCDQSGSARIRIWENITLPLEADITKALPVTKIAHGDFAECISADSLKCLGRYGQNWVLLGFVTCM